MGLDLFVFAERRTASGGWERAEALVSDPFSRLGHRFTSPDREFMTEAWESPSDEVYHERFYDSRVSSLHDALSFASDSPSATEPIAPDRGLPTDATQSVNEAAESFGTDAFGHSWALVSELDAFDWNQTVEQGSEGNDTRTYREAAYHFVDQSLPILRSYGPPRDVRIIFWFC